HGRDNTAFADDGAIHDHRVHADQGIASYGASVQHGAVPDMAIHIDQGVVFGYAVNNAAVLYVGALVERDAAEIATQACQGSYVHARPDDDVANQHGRRMHVGTGVDNRRDAVYGIDFEHWAGLHNILDDSSRLYTTGLATI